MRPLGEIPRTPDAVQARAVIRNGSFGLDGSNVGVGPGAVPFRVFPIYGANGADARRVSLGVAELPWVGGNVPIFGVGLGGVAFVTWPLPDLLRPALALALTRRRSVA